MDSNYLPKLGQRIKRLRELRGMSVGEVSGKSGVSTVDISTLEAGADDTGVVSIGQIVKVLDGNIDEIFGY